MIDTFTIGYHGTTTIQQFSMMQSNGIQLEYSAKATDFGQGFYVTSNYEQATAWAHRKVRKERAEYGMTNQRTNQAVIEDMIQPVVLRYAVNLSQLRQLRGREFTEPDESWADFILENRSNPVSYVQMDYDYAVGPVADGNVFRIMLDLQHHRISENEFREAVQPKGKMRAYNQLSIHSIKAVQYLQYEGSEQV